MRPTKVVIPSRMMVPPPAHDFVIGERVRHVKTGQEGVVVVLPRPSLPFGRDYSAALGVDMDDGTRHLAWVDQWEKVAS